MAKIKNNVYKIMQKLEIIVVKYYLRKQRLWWDAYTYPQYAVWRILNNAPLCLFNGLEAVFTAGKFVETSSPEDKYDTWRFKMPSSIECVRKWGSTPIMQMQHSSGSLQTEVIDQQFLETGWEGFGCWE